MSLSNGPLRLIKGAEGLTEIIMEKLPIAKTIFIGIGNEYRNDDGVGIYIVRQLAKYNFPKEDLFELSGEGIQLMEAWEGAEHVFIFDASASGAEPGTIFRFDAHEQKVPSDFFNYSTHNFSLAEAIELSRVLKRLPPHLIIFGIEGEDFSQGTDISDSVKASADRVVQTVLSDKNSLDEFDSNKIRASKTEHKKQRSSLW